MLELITWVAICFVSGSLPWAVLVSRFLVHGDVRSVGDGNPGVANTWKLGGWVPGTISLILEVAKSLIPIYFATLYLGQPSSTTSEISLALVAIAPITGHAWSPFLKLKGGKALAATWGSWIALTGGMAFPIGCVLLGLIHGFQKNHAVTVTLCLFLFLPIFLLPEIRLHIIVLWFMNLAIVISKHKSEYSNGLILRRWVLAITRG